MGTKEQPSLVFNLDTKKQKSCAWGSLAAQRLVEDQKLKKINMSCETYLWESPGFWKQMDINFTAQHVNPEQKHLLCVAQSTFIYVHPCVSLCTSCVLDLPSLPWWMPTYPIFCHLCHIVAKEHGKRAQKRVFKKLYSVIVIPNGSQ